MRKYKNWEVTKDAIYFKKYNYEITRDRIDNAEKAIEWVLHLNEKTWFAGEVMEEFIDILDFELKLRKYISC